MDKLKMAHDWFMKHGRESCYTTIDVASAWKYADKMQAEADSRVNKERSGVLKDDWMKEVEKDAIPEGFVLVPKEMSWQKANEISMEHWNRYQYSHEVQHQGQNASNSSMELERLRWCKNKAQQIMKDYKDVIDMVWEQEELQDSLRKRP